MSLNTVEGETTLLSGGPPSAAGSQRPASVLLLGHNYSPEMTGIGPYNTDLAEHLAGNGNRVTVLTTFPHYPRYRWLAAPPPLFTRACVNGVTVRRARVILPRRPGPAWRIVFDSSVGLSYLLNSVGVSRPDVIIATVPTLQGGLVASVLARAWGARSVLIIQDLPVEAGMAVGMLREGLGARAGRGLERMVFGRASHAVVIADQFRDTLIEMGVNPTRITVIPNWVDLERIAPRSANPAVRRRLCGSNDGFLAVYTGAMAGKQGLRTVVDAARILSADRNAHMVLVGDGPERGSIEEQISSAGLANIRVLGIQPAESFPDVLAAADVLLLTQRSDVRDSVVPSKLISYMAAGRPIIASVNEGSVAAALVNDANCGLVVRPESPPHLAEAIQQLGSRDELRRALGLSGRRYAERHYARSDALTRWSSLIQELARPQRR